MRHSRSYCCVGPYATRIVIRLVFDETYIDRFNHFACGGFGVRLNDLFEPYQTVCLRSKARELFSGLPLSLGLEIMASSLTWHQDRKMNLNDASTSLNNHDSRHRLQFYSISFNASLYSVIPITPLLFLLFRVRCCPSSSPLFVISLFIRRNPQTILLPSIRFHAPPQCFSQSIFPSCPPLILTSHKTHLSTFVCFISSPLSLISSPICKATH